MNIKPEDRGGVWYWTEEVDGVPIRCHRYYAGDMAGDFHADAPNGEHVAVYAGAMGFFELQWLRGGHARCERKAIEKLARQYNARPPAAPFRRAGEK